MAYKGKFKAKNTDKYKGNAANIVYRSLWERQCMKYFDGTDDIMEWSSEEIVVPYVSVDGRVHKYYVDFWFKKADGSTFLMEVKPLRQCKPPVKKKRITRKFLNEVTTYKINMNKWLAARKYAADHGWKFIIVTEKNLPRIKTVKSA